MLTNLLLLLLILVASSVKKPGNIQISYFRVFINLYTYTIFCHLLMIHTEGFCIQYYLSYLSNLKSVPRNGEHWPRVTRHVSKLLPFRVLIRSSLVLILLHCTYLAQNGEKRIGRLEETFSAIFATLCLTERQKNGIAGHLWPNQGGNWPFCWIWLTFCLPRVVTVPSCIHTESFLLAPRLLNLTGFQEMVHCPTCTLLFYIFYWEQNFPKTRVLSKNIGYAKTVDFIFIFVLCFEFQCQEPFIFHQKFIFLVICLHQKYSQLYKCKI